MSGVQVSAEAGDSSAVVLAPPQQQQHLQEVTVVTQFSPEAVDGTITSEVVLAPPQQQQKQGQEVTVTQFSPEAVDEIIRRYKAFPKSETDKVDEMRGWLMVLATLTASITYIAALNPPGGVWQADDATNGYVAGDPVLRDKWPRRYATFYYFNIMSFVSSVCIIAQLSVPKLFDRVSIHMCDNLVAIDIISLIVAFVAVSDRSHKGFICCFSLLAIVFLYVVVGKLVHWVVRHRPVF